MPRKKAQPTTDEQLPPLRGSTPEIKFAAQLVEHGIAGFMREHQFFKGRRWRVDFANPDLMIIIEIEGGLFGKPVICNNCGRPVMHIAKGGKRFQVREAGRHNTGAGFRNDAEKYNTAELMGWMVLRFPSDWVTNGTAIKVTEEAIKVREDGRRSGGAGRAMV